MVRHADDHDRLPDDPSPEEIRARCERIRMRWSKRVLKSRRRVAVSTWNVPMIPIEEIVDGNN